MSERKLRNLTSEYLTCTICWNIYSSPKLLECGHSFCAKCLVDYVRIVQKQRDYFECPICRHSYDIGSDVDPVLIVETFTSDTLSLSLLKAIGVRTDDNNKSDSIDIPDSVKYTPSDAQQDNDKTSCACARHRDNQLDTYCTTHDIVICAECAKENHSGKECQCSPARKVINKRMNALKCLVAQQVSDASRLLDCENRDVKTVRSMHEDIQKCITEVEESFNDMYRTFKRRIEGIRQKTKETIETDTSLLEVQRLKEYLVANIKQLANDSADTNPNEVLKSISALCLVSSDLQKNIHSLDEKVKTGSLMKYAESDLNVLDAFVSGLKGSLPGEFLTLQENNHDDSNDKDFVMITESGTFEDFSDMTLDCTEVMQQVTFSAKGPDETKCMLSGVALVGTTAVVIVDQANKSIKKFKIPEGMFLNMLQIEHEPHQAATVKGSSDVAISLWDVPKILIVSTDPVLVVSKEIDTSTEYIGLTSHIADCLAASSIVSRRVDVLDTSSFEDNSVGRQHTIYQSSRRRSFPDRLTATDDGKLVVRNRRRNEVCCFGRNRMLLWSRRLKKSVADITCFRGRVFATIRDKNDIVSFREDGQGDLEHLNVQNIRHPWAIDGFKDCLVITEDSPSHVVHIIVFK